MEQAGISKRLIDFAQALVGHRKSGIVLVTVLTAIFLRRFLDRVQQQLLQLAES